MHPGCRDTPAVTRLFGKKCRIPPAGIAEGGSMRIFKAYLQHRFNPLHVYCRLRDCGLSSRFAIRVSNAYERFYKVCGLGGVQ